MLVWSVLQTDFPVAAGTSVPSVRLEMCLSLRQVERECEVGPPSPGKPYAVSRAWPPEQSVSGLHSVSATNRLPDFD